VPRMDGAENDDFLFNQGPARGLGKIRFHDYDPIFKDSSLPNVVIFRLQVAWFKQFLAAATPSEEQKKDVDFLLALGEIFTLVVYAQLILENAFIYGVEDALLDQVFYFMVRDLSRHALTLYSKPSSTSDQMALCMKMVRKPAVDPERFDRVWDEVHSLRDAYQMNP